MPPAVVLPSVGTEHLVFSLRSKAGAAPALQQSRYPHQRVVRVNEFGGRWVGVCVLCQLGKTIRSSRIPVIFKMNHESFFLPLVYTMICFLHCFAIFQ